MVANLPAFLPCTSPLQSSLSCTLSLCLSTGHELVKPKISAVRSSQHIHQKRNCAPFPFHLFTRASRVSRVTDRERMLLLRLKSLGVVCVIRNTFLSVCYLQSSRHHKTKRGIKGIRSLQNSGAVWKSRWPVPNKHTVSVMDVKQHFNNNDMISSSECEMILTTKRHVTE